MTAPEAGRRLTAWFLQWRLPLRRFLQKKSRLADADLDDVAQEVFLRLLRYDRVDIIEQPQAYLFKMASNVAAEWSLRSRNSQPHDHKWLADLKTEDQPEDNVERIVAQDEIQRALNTLAPRQREALRLHIAEGLVYPAIATRLGTTQRSVKRILAQSYQKLRHELDPELLGGVGHGRE